MADWVPDELRPDPPPAPDAGLEEGEEPPPPRRVVGNRPAADWVPDEYLTPEEPEPERNPWDVHPDLIEQGRFLQHGVEGGEGGGAYPLGGMGMSGSVGSGPMMSGGSLLHPSDAMRKRRKRRSGVSLAERAAAGRGQAGLPGTPQAGLLR